MGFFSIRGEEIVDIHKQVWFPNMESASERTRVLNQPGIKDRFEHVRAEQDAEAAIFEINKTVKGPYAKVASSRPGIVARTSETTFDVHLPIRRYPFDIGSLAVEEVQFDPDFVQQHEEAGTNVGQLAVAHAIRAQVATPSS
jgi:hypothetical protein